MTSYTSVVILIPQALLDDANRLFRWLGRDEAPDPGATFNIPRLSGNGLEPRTYGCTYDASVQLEILQAWIDMKATNTLPTEIPAADWVAPDLTEFNLTQARALEVVAGLELSLNQSDILPITFLQAILSAKGLQIIPVEQ
jgi:hypothetical protein